MTVTRREMIRGSAATLAAATLGGARAFAAEGDGGLRVRFLGTGAADWAGPDPKLGHRRLTSVLLDGRVLVDFTRSDLDMLPAGCRPEAVFYTHSHGDHYDPALAVRIGVKRAYCHASWAEGLRTELKAAAEKAGAPAPDVRALAFGERAEEAGIVLTSLPANHATNRAGEHCSMYLVEKGATRLLYATDTAGIPVEAARIVGIDAHVKPGNPITALIMEATMGADYADDWRLFAHSSVATVAQTVRVLTETGRYIPRVPGQKVHLTHLARTLHGPHADIAARAPSPLEPAFDGLEVVL